MLLQVIAILLLHLMVLQLILMCLNQYHHPGIQQLAIPVPSNPPVIVDVVAPSIASANNPQNSNSADIIMSSE